ncbi:MAG: primosomal protein N' [Candidatus Magasanikbacteria bacterium CG_4_9_14_3_um_filter_32_9]|uniref:Primosomal protein N n=1 Tax=Candidatus Magasanikbacteria bacterium CG_4_9_14_3_um_filter_32_9 TaxID=1974644 RepID=A0A2M7Z6X8_9BACT|nr:MAG: primosomal protein N' [Candidatus Magasanikbacteria bacterium CG_4_9_14_3_um_filter_32_9]
MPFGLGWFDYKIPIELEKSIQIGQLVKIPFRRSSLFGIVFEITAETEIKGGAKEIEKIILETPILTSKYIKFGMLCAKFYGVSPTIFFRMMLPPLQARKLQKVKLNKIKEVVKKPKKTKFFIYKNLEEQKKYLTKIISEPTLILVPEKEDLENILNLLPKEGVISWHSGLTEKEQFDTWFKIRNGEKKIIVGTRGAIFLPIPNLKNIVIDKEHHEGHKHWDQNPRYHTKDIANLYAKIFGIQTNLMDFSPSSESYFYIYKEIYNVPKNTKQKISSPPKELPKIINMVNERKGKNYSSFSWEVEQKMKEETGDIFLYINRRGLAGCLICNNCGHIERCEKCNLPLVTHENTKTLQCHYCKIKKNNFNQCLKCRSVNIKNFGTGTQGVEKELKKILPHKEIYRIDGDDENVEFKNEDQRIIVGTAKAFRNIRWEKTKLIIFVNIDTELNLPEFGAQEKIWHLIQKVQFIKEKNCLFFIQTLSPDYFLFKSLFEPDRFYRMDLNGRKALSYPPYNFIVKYIYGHENEFTAHKEAEKLYNTLTNKAKTCKILGPLQSTPMFYRRKYWFVVLLKKKLNETEENRYTIYKEIAEINKEIPSDWRIDPNPLSLLSV